MSQTFVNPFTPQTPIGAGLQNIAAALFSGPSPYDLEDRRQKAALNAAHARYYDASADEVRSRADARRSAEAAIESAPRVMAGHLFGDQRKADEYLAHVRGDTVPTLGVGQTGGMDGGGGDGPAYAPARVPLPQGVPADTLARAARLLTGISAARALPGNDNLKHLSDMVAGLLNDEVRQGALSGAQSPAQMQRFGRATAAAAGRPLFDQGQYGAMDNFTGSFADPALFNAATNLTNAKKDTEVTHQGAYRAQEVNSYASAGEHNATRRLRNLQGDAAVLVPAVDAEGNPIMHADGTGPVQIPTGRRGEIVMQGRNQIARDDNKAVNTTVYGTPGRAGAAKDLPKVNDKSIAAAMQRVADLPDNVKLDPGFAMEVAARAGRVTQDRNSPNFNNPTGAVQQVWDEMTGGQPLEDISGSWMSSNKRMAPKGYKPGAGAAAPAQPGRPAQQSAQQPQQSAPAGAADPVLQQAEEAIRKGADRNKVIERLKKMGYTIKDA